MKRLALGLSVILANITVAGVALAQEPEAGPASSAPADTGIAPAAGSSSGAASSGSAPAPGPDIDLSDLNVSGPEETTKTPSQVAALRRRSWEDIVVVPRKAFLKKHRLELAPFTGITLNDPLIRHYSFGADLNYYLTDVLSIGLEGQYFIKELSERESLTGAQYYLVPTLNRLRYQYSLTFGYVPGYGKFGLFNKWIVHWDLAFALGVGRIHTEIIPRAFGDASFSNDDLTVHPGLGVRLFVLDWLTLSLTFRDYIYRDVFEFQGRRPGEDIAKVKQDSENSQTQLVQNIMMFFSIGFYIPPSFTYHTPR